MRQSWVHGVAAAVLVAACAPITTHRRITESVDSRADVIGTPIRTANQAEAGTADNQLSIRIFVRDTCQVSTIEKFHRIEHTNRSVNKPVVVLEYLFGVALGAAGAFALIDPDRASVELQSVTEVSRDETVKLGAGAAALGGVTLLFAIVNSTRGGSSSKQLGPEERSVGAAREAPCGERAMTGRTLVIVAGDRSAPLAQTDINGRTAASWDTLSPALLEGAAAPDRANLHLDDANGPVLLEIDLGAPRKAAIERAWAETQTAGTARAAAAFRSRFPDAHTVEVTQKLDAVGEGELDAEVGAALAANDLAKARALITEWAALIPASTRRLARDTEVAAREVEARVVSLTTGIDAALTTPAEPTDLGSLTRAVSLSTELSALAPADPRTLLAQSKVLAARKARQALLFGSARAAEKAQQLPEALKLADLAIEALPDAPKAIKLRAELRKKVGRAYATDARDHARKLDFEAAAESLSRAEAVLPGDREVIAARKRVTAAQVTAEAAITNAGERERRTDERQARETELRAAREAEKQKQEAERVARIEERKRKEDDARAAREAERLGVIEQRKRKEEEVRAARVAEELQLDLEGMGKLDEKKRKEEEARLAREAQKQKQDAERLAKLDEKKRKEEETRLAREARKQQQDAERLAKLDPRKRKAELAKRGTPPDDTSVKVPGAPRGDAAARIPSAAFTGMWAAAGEAAGSRVTLIFHATPSGAGLVSMLGPTGRVLARQAVAWRLGESGLAIDGAAKLALSGPAKLHGNNLMWAGYRWRRIRGRTTLAEIPPVAKPSAPPTSQPFTQPAPKDQR